MFIEFSQRIFGVGVAKIGGSAEVIGGFFKIREDAIVVQGHFAEKVESGRMFLRRRALQIFSG